MSSTVAEFFSRDEILGGLPARRASTALFSLQSHVASLDARAQYAMARFVTRQSIEEGEHVFLQAVSHGRDLPTPPTIQILERYAPESLSLVPTDIGVRAALAHLIAEEYRFEKRDVSKLRAALGWDDPAVQESYARMYGKPLETIYVSRTPFRERVRWIWADLSYRLEHLPPFTTAFALTLTETIGASILALPIALAGIGALAGVIQLILLGLVNIVTIIGVSEAVIRNGNMRYWRGGYFGELVGSYFGRGGSVVFTIGLFILISISLIAFYLGVSKTLADATGIREEFWALCLFLVNLYFLRRQTLSATVAFALFVGFINISLILVLSVLAFPHIRLSNLLYFNVPFIGGRPLDPSDLKLILGVVLLAYFGHTSTANCARVVLRREPTGRALIQGNVAAMLTAMVLYCIWVVAINGAIEPEVLSRQTGTIIGPLAAKLGPIAQVLGSVYVVLGVGMVSVHFTLGLFRQMHQSLPTHLMRRVLDQRSRFWLGVAPVALVFAIIEGLLLTNRGTFSGTLGFVGVLKGSLLGGIFPMLMLAASRRKGEYVPGIALRILDNPAMLVGIYLIFLSSIFLHGLVIWEDWLSRLAALAIGAVALTMPIAFLHSGRFKSRVTIECRAEENAGNCGMFSVTANGKPLPSKIGLKFIDHEDQVHASAGDIEKFSDLRTMSVDVPKTAARELKVWVHHINQEENSVWLPARVQVSNSHGVVADDVIDRESVLPLPKNGTGYRIDIQFLPSEEEMLRIQA